MNSAKLNFKVLLWPTMQIQMKNDLNTVLNLRGPSFFHRCTTEPDDQQRVK